MSREAWFQQFERLEAEMENGEIPQMTEKELGHATHLSLVSKMADQADQWKYQRKHGAYR